MNLKISQYNKEDILIVFVKYPEPGRVKTRLAKEIGNEDAAEIYSSMAKSIIDKVTKSNSYNVALFFDPPNKKNQIINWLNNNKYELFSQEGDSLGERMANAFNTVFSRGYRKAIIIGTDCIEISGDLISKSFDILSNTEVVLGPAKDGGYYLIGLNKFMPDIFSGITWSTQYVLEQTINKIENCGCKVEFLKTLSDIDTIKEVGEQSINLFCKS